jgi:CAAX protease family protein
MALRRVESSPRLTAGGRWLSALELCLGGAIVLGHNVYHLVPNEVPILFVVGWLSVRMRNDRWAAIGFKRPPSWTRIVGLALAAAALRILLGDFVIEPLGAHFWPAIKGPGGSEQIAGNIKLALFGLLLIWTFAAFGEEIVYRGYLTLRGAEVGGGSTVAIWGATLLVSVLFGFGHYYKGPAGILDSSMAGLILGAVYLISGRNLWAAVLSHGFIDTYAVVALFLGWES